VQAMIMQVILQVERIQADRLLLVHQI